VKRGTNGREQPQALFYKCCIRASSETWQMSKYVSCPVQTLVTLSPPLLYGSCNKNPKRFNIVWHRRHTQRNSVTEDTVDLSQATLVATEFDLGLYQKTIKQTRGN